MEIMSRPRAVIALAFTTLVAVSAIRIGAQAPDAKSMASAPKASAPTASAPTASAPTASAPTAAQIEFFEANIRPVLIDTCGECHTDDEKGDLRTDSREALSKGGETGPAIVPGDPGKSLLIQAIRHEGDAPKMPKKKAMLPDATIAA